jgi:hypothetical protein
MGLFTKKRLAEIDNLIRNDGIYSGITFVPYMQKGEDIILYNRSDEELYYLKEGDLEKCYKVQTKAGFLKSVDDLEKQGWTIL